MLVVSRYNDYYYYYGNYFYFLMLDPSLQNSVPSKIAIEQCCWKETGNYSVLVLVCNNGIKI